GLADRQQAHRCRVPANPRAGRMDARLDGLQIVLEVRQRGGRWIRRGGGWERGLDVQWRASESKSEGWRNRARVRRNVRCGASADAAPIVAPAGCRLRRCMHYDGAMPTTLPELSAL